ncbi:MAG: SDR family oxidoreductase [Bacteroidetes bacterium]|nr:SDR family oxidoreductase [Bacteroidota bacterium]
MKTLDLFSLHGRVALVTGGAGLYGKPICRALAEAGATVVVASRDRDACLAVAEVLVADGLHAAACSLDQADEGSIRACVQKVCRDFGRIDILVNNAVTREGMADLGMLTKAGWEQAQQVNATGLMLLTQAVVAQMLQQGSGNILNIGSIQGAVGPHFPIYGDTGMTSPLNYTYDKWAMVGFTKWIANRHGKDGIRCNCISPGGYGPGVAERIGENAFTENYRRLTPLGRFCGEDDIKGAVVYLASDASAYVTGHNLLVDGGWTSW